MPSGCSLRKLYCTQSTTQRGGSILAAGFSTASGWGETTCVTVTPLKDTEGKAQYPSPPLWNWYMWQALFFPSFWTVLQSHTPWHPLLCQISFLGWFRLPGSSTIIQSFALFPCVRSTAGTSSSTQQLPVQEHQWKTKGHHGSHWEQSHRNHTGVSNTDTWLASRAPTQLNTCYEHFEHHNAGASQLTGISSIGITQNTYNILFIRAVQVFKGNIKIWIVELLVIKAGETQQGGVVATAQPASTQNIQQSLPDWLCVEKHHLEQRHGTTQASPWKQATFPPTGAIPSLAGDHFVSTHCNWNQQLPVLQREETLYQHIQRHLVCHKPLPLSKKRAEKKPELLVKCVTIWCKSKGFLHWCFCI